LKLRIGREYITDVRGILPIRRKLFHGYKLRIQHIPIIQLHVTIRSSVTITFFDPAPSFLKTREIQLELVL